MLRRQRAPIEAVGQIIIGTRRGLSSPLAGQLRDRAYRFQCTATIDNGRGAVADSRSLLQLLLLGAKEGDRVTLRCVGPDARLAFETLAQVLEQSGVSA